MANYPIGRLIAELRNRHGLTQEELAGGICSVSTVSKIENGAQMPRRKIYEALLQRLGVTPRNCTAYVSEKEMRRSVLEVKIEGLMEDGKYDQAKNALTEYVTDQRAAPPSDIHELLIYIGEKQCRAPGEGLSLLEAQYALYQLAVLVQMQQLDCVRALALFERAGQLTIPEFTLDRLPKSQLLSRLEICILCRCAFLLYETGERRRAERLLYYLKEYMELRVIDPEEKSHMYPEVIRLLSHWMGEDGRFDRQLELSNQGLELCSRQMRKCALPYLLEEKGYALAAGMQPERAESILKQAYFFYCAIGDSATAERLRAKVMALFQIDVA